MSRPALRRALPAGLFAAALALTACGSDDDTADASGGGSGGGDVVEDGGGDAPVDTGAPEECADAFPTAFGVADVADVELLPADFPEPPADSTLCETGGTVGGGQEYLNYATDLDEEGVFSYYEGTLSADYAAERTEDGLGRPILAGANGDLFWQIEFEDGGGFSIVLAQE